MPKAYCSHSYTSCPGAAPTHVSMPTTKLGRGTDRPGTLLISAARGIEARRAEELGIPAAGSAGLGTREPGPARRTRHTPHVPDE